MKRLLADSHLPTELRGDLLRARAAGHDYPVSAKLLQLRAAVTERAPQPLDGIKALPKRALYSAWKLSALLVLGGGAAFLAQTVMPVPESAALPLRAADTIPVEAPAALSSTDQAPPVLVAEVVPPSAAPPETVAPAETSSSRREIAQLVRIRGLLERNPAAARRLAVRSEREFPRGLLSEERRALAIVALAKTGSKQLAEQDAQRYFVRYPHSPLRELIEAALRHYPPTHLR
jgi:hypothetical protein